MNFLASRRHPALLVTIATLASAICTSAMSYQARAGSRIVDCHVGLGDQYKVGHWTPVWITVDHEDESTWLRVEVTALDNDGLETVVASAVPLPDASGRSTALVYTKIGQMDCPLAVTLIGDDRELDHVVLQPGPEASATRILPGLSATSQLLAVYGSAPIGLDEAYASRASDNNPFGRRIVKLTEVDQLPVDWFGYDALDVLVITTGDVEPIHRLAADHGRTSALRRWVELGGRLVVLCAQNGAELLAAGGPLAQFLPGRFDEMVSLSELTPLEQFSGSEVPIALRGTQLELPVPKLSDVTGRIEAYAGREPADLPLVVRAPRGLGEVVFAAVDLDAPPLASWQGRDEFLRRLLDLEASSTDLDDGGSHTLVTLGYNDLAGALRQHLGRSFPGVRTISFSMVALLAVVYLLLVGPLDYFVVHRLLKKPWMAWVTFPLLVVMTCGAVVWLDRSTKGEMALVQQVELVDFDASTNTARGSYWATLYSPRAKRFDLSLAVELPGVRKSSEAEMLFSWLGLTGSGLGGMQVRTTGFATGNIPYYITPTLDALIGAPVFHASTKSLQARWVAPIVTPLVAQLSTDRDGLVVGTVRNDSGVELKDVSLLYGQWAYRLGTLSPGDQIDIGPRLDAVRLKTLLMRSSSTYSDDNARTPFAPEQASLDSLLNMLMFYDALGGKAVAGLPSRYDADCDLSRLLELGRAIVIARPATLGSELIEWPSSDPITPAGDLRTVVYRFVLPVAAGESFEP